MKFMDQFSKKVDVSKDDEIKKMLHGTIGTKFINRWFDQFSSIAIEAVRTIAVNNNGRTEIDIKRFLRVEKVSWKIYFEERKNN